MSGVIIDTRSGDFAKTHATDRTDTSFPSKIPTRTEPTNDGVINLGFGGSCAPNGLILVPIGTGADDAVLTGMRVIGWRRLKSNNLSKTDLWVPVKLLEVAAVFGNITGVLDSMLGTTYFFMDTITLVGTSGNANISHELVSPADNTVAHIVVDAKGFQKVEVTFDLGANATAANCLYATL